MSSDYSWDFMKPMINQEWDQKMSNHDDSAQDDINFFFNEECLYR